MTTLYEFLLEIGSPSVCVSVPIRNACLFHSEAKRLHEC